MAIGNMSAVALAKQRAEQQGGGSNASFFGLKEGEKKCLRFLTGMIDSYVVSHNCGLQMYDFSKETWSELESAGQQPLCPNCNNPLAKDDILFERHEHQVADIHNYFPTSEADKRATFVCLASPVNAGRHLVPTDDNGNPLYQCPACSCSFNKNKETGQPKKPTMRLYGIAIERDVVMSNEMVNGVMTPVVKGVRDVIVEDEGGKSHPKLVIVQMGWNNFWSKLAAFDSSYQQSICLYDWYITRIGSGLQTTYDVQRVSNSPTIVDPRQYEEWMPDVDAIIKNQGNPSYYVKRGYQVPGYVADEAPQNAAGTAQAAIQNAAMGVPQPAYQADQPVMQPQAANQAIPTAQPMQQGIPQAAPQPMQPQYAQGGSNDWSVVQNQFS